MFNSDELNDCLLTRGESIIYDIINVQIINGIKYDYTKDINCYNIINLSNNKKLYILKIIY